MRRSGLDLADKLAEYGWMDAPNKFADREDGSSSPLRGRRLRNAVWAIGLLAVVVITALVFGAYRQPELLLNLMGLRYCG